MAMAHEEARHKYKEVVLEIHDRIGVVKVVYFFKICAIRRLIDVVEPPESSEFLRG